MVAATTSMMLGWYMHYKDIDKTITIFLNLEKGDMTYLSLEEVQKYKEKRMMTKTIWNK